MIVRFGLLTLGTAAFVGAMVSIHPMTFDVSSWHASLSFLPMLITVALIGFAARNSLAGGPVLREVRADLAA